MLIGFRLAIYFQVLIIIELITHCMNLDSIKVMSEFFILSFQKIKKKIAII